MTQALEQGDYVVAQMLGTSVLQHIEFLTTTQPEHQGALQAWSTNSSGKALRQEEETTDSICCIGSSMDWSIYSQTDTYNTVTDEQEGNIVSTKKELGVRPTVIPSSQEQPGTGTCYHLGQHQRNHWRDSGQTLLFPTSIQLLDSQLLMYIVLTDFKLYIYFGPLTADPPQACQCRRTSYILKRTRKKMPI